MNDTQAGNGGVSTIEVLIALSLFIVAGGAMASAHLFGHQLSEYATSTMKAVNDLEQVMERVHATPFADLRTSFPDGIPNGGPVNAYVAIVNGYTLEGEQITVTYPSQTADRLEVLVTVSWVQRGRARSRSLSTARTRG